jgi:hypothetical protein
MRPSGDYERKPAQEWTASPTRLPILRVTDELQEHLAVLSGSLQHLAEVAQSPNSRDEADVGEV